MMAVRRGSQQQRTSSEFLPCYTNLCAQQGVCPINSMRAHKANITSSCLSIKVDRLQPEDWYPLLDALKCNASLKTVSLRSIWFQVHRTKEDEKARRQNRGLLAPHLRQPPSIHNSDATYDLAKALKSMLLQNNFITRLELVGIPFRRRDLRILSQGIARAPLMTLRISDCLLDNQHCAILCDALQVSTTLATVDLSRNAFTTRGLRHVLDVIKSQEANRGATAWHTSLRGRQPDMRVFSGILNLDLSDNPLLGDEAVEELYNVLVDDLWLLRLSLRGCGITSASAHLLHTLMAKNSNLIHVDLTENQLSQLTLDTCERHLAFNRGETRNRPWEEHQIAAKHNWAALHTDSAHETKHAAPFGATTASRKQAIPKANKKNRKKNAKPRRPQPSVRRAARTGPRSRDQRVNIRTERPAQQHARGANGRSGRSGAAGPMARHSSRHHVHHDHNRDDDHSRDSGSGSGGGYALPHHHRRHRGGGEEESEGRMRQRVEQELVEEIRAHARGVAGSATSTADDGASVPGRGASSGYSDEFDDDDHQLASAKAMVKGHAFLAADRVHHISNAGQRDGAPNAFPHTTDTASASAAAAAAATTTAPAHHPPQPDGAPAFEGDEQLSHARRSSQQMLTKYGMLHRDGSSRRGAANGQVLDHGVGADVGGVEGDDGDVSVSVDRELHHLDEADRRIDETLEHLESGRQRLRQRLDASSSRLSDSLASVRRLLRQPVAPTRTGTRARGVAHDGDDSGRNDRHHDHHGRQQQRTKHGARVSALPSSSTRSSASGAGDDSFDRPALSLRDLRAGPPTPQRMHTHHRHSHRGGDAGSSSGGGTENHTTQRQSLSQIARLKKELLRISSAGAADSGEEDDKLMAIEESIRRLHGLLDRMSTQMR
ncbi:hypothetical protein PTSG_01384 [Salpingoeca rosetta]|uniref:Centrosomal protein of 78 kDa n=1 Tax=Salpingoeca rosetta (strain ATCC 50818 / BSB-021) TaxID=946362 RepID=F2U067_SALR5|nr:uncharacterized protein PTSG_01384 [Salpingoeca rosetta]EGD80795.1 hypothetical protein PTSG_01384 [Salpingoeca rosetta]|eukprot:XP_004997356.1 hypothetical protein PTSG_01384 [Salpingoeca rosetta]